MLALCYKNRIYFQAFNAHFFCEQLIYISINGLICLIRCTF